jgi:hypothetical protein
VWLVPRMLNMGAQVQVQAQAQVQVQVQVVPP